MNVVLIICSVLLATGAVCAIIRAERGPSMLDRTIALDVMVTILIAATALYAAMSRRSDVVPILVVLSLVGFVGSTTIARFAAVEPEDAGRVMSRAEAAAQAAAERALEEAMHDGLTERAAAEQDEADALDGAHALEAEGEPGNPDGAGFAVTSPDGLGARPWDAVVPGDAAVPGESEPSADADPGPVPAEDDGGEAR